MRCRKVRYPDRVAALLTLAVAGRRRSGRRQECRAYECPRCRGWHLTSKP